MTDGGRRLRVGLIGAGRRMQNNFLPALACLPDLFEVAWMHSRTPERLAAAAAPWGVRTRDDLADLDGVDVVAVSVPIEQNPVVLERLLPRAAQLDLVIDTPIAASLGGCRRVAPLLKAFRRVTVTEDYMNFPAFELARQAVGEGLVGRVTEVNLNGLGYRYHGLALIRSFADFRFARSARRRGLGRGFDLVGWRFGGGLRASVAGPYRRDQGVFAVIGTEGTLVSFPEGGMFGPPDYPVHALRPIRDADGLAGYALGERRLDLPQLARLRALPYADKSEINLTRSCGLMQVFQSLHRPDLNTRYGWRNALYDSLANRLVERFGRFVDPTAWAGSNVLDLMLGPTAAARAAAPAPGAAAATPAAAARAATS